MENHTHKKKMCCGKLDLVEEGEQNKMTMASPVPRKFYYSLEIDARIKTSCQKYRTAKLDLVE